jgi:glutaryl-CoA dehydrogenase
LGATRDCLLAAALSYADSRVRFGKPISGLQLRQKKLADRSVWLNTAMLLVRHLGCLEDTGRLRREQVSVGPGRRHLAGVLAATPRDNPESVMTYEGTHEIHTLVVGHALTGRVAYR